MLDYYKKKENMDGTITFEPVYDMKICGLNIPEVIDILNGLELERKLDIKITMENLRELFNKMIEEQNQALRKFLEYQYGKGN